jgi:cysteine desulfurase
VLQAVNEIGKIAAEADVYFHTDAVQAAGKIPVDVKEIGCDLLTSRRISFMGRKGAGALFVRKGTLPQPLFYGGRHERSRRAGTENLAGIVGLGKAAEIARLGLCGRQCCTACGVA